MEIKALKPVGYFRELDANIKSGPSLKASMSEKPLIQEAAVVAYLRNCPVLMWSPELLADVLDTKREIGTYAVHSDGKWQWRSDLAYYVENYHVSLDEKFVMHMAMRNWRPPAEWEIGVSAENLFA